MYTIIGFNGNIDLKYIPLWPFIFMWNLPPNISGKLALKKSKTHRDKFERGNTDEFEMDTVNVGEITSIK